MRMPRLYYLDGQEVPSRSVGGAVHICKKDLGSCCSCGEPVKKGQKYVQMFIFGFADPIHLKCYLEDHLSSKEPVILATSTTKTTRFGIERVKVLCKEFTEGDLKDV
jgi:hypothetical protein